MHVHLKRNELVISLRFVDFAIIAESDATALLQPGLPDPLARQFCLLPAESDAVYLHAIALRGIDNQAAPTTTEIQQTFSRRRRNLRQT